MDKKSEDKPKGSFFNKLTSLRDKLSTSIVNLKKTAELLPIGDKKPVDLTQPSSGSSELELDSMSDLSDLFAKKGTKEKKEEKKKDKFEEAVKSLKDPVPYLRKQAANELGNFGDKRAIEPLIKLLSDEDMEVRMITARALGKLGDETFINKMINTLADSNEYLREQTIQVLVSAGDIAVKPLIESLQSDNWMLPYYAIKALGRIGNPEAIRALAKSLEDDSSVYVQKAAVEALEKMGKQAEPELLQWFDYKEWYVKDRIINILVKIGGKDSLNKLKETLERERDQKIRKKIEESIAKLEVKLKG